MVRGSSEGVAPDPYFDIIGLRSSQDNHNGLLVVVGVRTRHEMIVRRLFEGVLLRT